MPAPSRSNRFGLALSAGLDRVTRAAAWLVLPLALLLFAQWPLRDLVGAWSRQANDIAHARPLYDQDRRTFRELLTASAAARNLPSASDSKM